MDGPQVEDGKGDRRRGRAASPTRRRRWLVLLGGPLLAAVTISVALALLLDRREPRREYVAVGDRPIAPAIADLVREANEAVIDTLRVFPDSPQALDAINEAIRLDPENVAYQQMRAALAE